MKLRNEREIEKRNIADVYWDLNLFPFTVSRMLYLEGEIYLAAQLLPGLEPLRACGCIVLDCVLPCYTTCCCVLFVLTGNSVVFAWVTENKENFF